MGCASNEVDQARKSCCKVRRAVATSSDRAAKPQEFDDFADEVRAELDPSGPLERLIAESVIEAAWRLKTAIERQSKDQNTAAKLATPKARIRPTAIETAARSVREAFEAFQACRRIQNRRRSSAFLLELRSEPEVAPNEWPIVPSTKLDGESAIDDDETPYWRDRLTFDFEVSDISPVVKGTWVTVGHVVSLIVDGWTWADILRSHPELTEDDIRACVTYAMDEENAPR